MTAAWLNFARWVWSNKTRLGARLDDLGRADNGVACRSASWAGCERGTFQVWGPDRTPEEASGTVPDVGLNLCCQEDGAAQAFKLPRRELHDLVHALHVHEVPASR